MKKLFKPKCVAIFALLMISISLFFMFFYCNKYIDSLIANPYIGPEIILIKQLNYLEMVIQGMYVLIYLVLLLKNKTDRYKSLNIILFIVSIIRGDIILAIITYGLIRHKNMPYKTLMMIKVVLTILGIISSAFLTSNGLDDYDNVISTIYNIGLCFFVIFMYQCAISFYKGGVNNE